MRRALLLLLVSSVALGQADGTIVRRRDVLGSGSTVIPTTVQTTSAARTYYVATTGSDSSACLAVTTPCLTIQGALGKIPKHIYHGTDVSVGSGSFAGFSLEGFQIHSSNQTLMPYINVAGTLATATVATGSATGTLTAFAAGSGAAFAVFTDGGQTWTVNDLKGKLLEVTGGTGSSATAFYVITSNTGTAITALSGTATAAAAGSTYAIRDWGTIINTFVVNQTGGPFGGALNWTTAGARVTGNSSEGLTGNGVSIQKLVFAFGSNSTGVFMDGSFRFDIQWVKFSTSVTTSLFMNRNVAGRISGCYFANNSTVGVSQGNSNSIAGGLSVLQSFFEGGTTAISISAPAAQVTGSFFKTQTSSSITLSTNGGNIGSSQINTSRIDGSGTGLLVNSSSTGGPGAAAIGMTTTDISNCTTGISLRSPLAAGVFDVVSGSSNTTGWNFALGAKAQIASTATLTGTTEVSIDGTSSALATMRGASPKLVSDTYFTIFYE